MSLKKYFFNKIEQYVKTIPATLCSSMVFILLICIIIFIIIRTLPQDESLIKTQVAVVSHDSEISDQLLNMGLNLLSNYNSIAMSFDFVPMNSEDAYKSLQNNEVIAIFELPEKAAEGILYRKNNPINIIFNKSNPLSESILTELTKSGASMLASAQTATYTVKFVISELVIDDSIDMNKVFSDIDTIGYRYVLNRENNFQNINNANKHNNLSFYICVIITFLFFLMGISISSETAKDNKSFILYGKRHKHFYTSYLFAKFLALTVYYLIFEILFLLLYFILCNNNAINKYITIETPNINFLTFVQLLLIAFFLSSFNHLIFFICRKSHEGILAIFIITFIFAFLKGLIIPIDFLGKTIPYINSFLPFEFVCNGFEFVLFNSGFNSIGLIIYSFINILLCMFILSKEK